jgi:hypothetical protein
MHTREREIGRTADTTGCVEFPKEDQAVLISGHLMLPPGTHLVTGEQAEQQMTCT